MEPDFKAFARAWITGDKRVKDMHPDKVEQLISKLAEAMDRRRRNVQSEPAGGGDLIVTVPSEVLSDITGLQPSAMRELSEIFAKHLAEE